MFFFEKHQFRNFEQGRDTKLIQAFSLVGHYINLWIVVNEEDSTESYCFNSYLDVRINLFIFI